MALKYTMANGAGFYAQNGSTEFQVVSSTGQLYQNGVAITANTSELNSLTYDLTVETVASSDGSCLGYGLSIIDGTGATRTYGVNAPIQAGITKRIFIKSCTDASIALQTTGGCYFMNSTLTSSNGTILTFTSAPASVAVTLVAATTAIWVPFVNSTAGYSISS